MENIDDYGFYKWSLTEANNEIKDRLKYKSGKDVVGAAMENHRRRLWEKHGFVITKNAKDSDVMFNADQIIKWGDKIIAFEEDKGHYLDSCFLERALSGFSKTIDKYQRKNKTVPVLIIHSFTRYKLYENKLNEDMITRKDNIANEIYKKLVYTTLTNEDRCKEWYSAKLTDQPNCYTLYANDELIMRDIQFIKSLIPNNY